MGKSTENSNKDPFLKKGLQGNIAKHHKTYLGTNVPEGYFAKSKISILEKIKEEQQVVEAPKKQKVFWLQTKFRYMAAASVVFLLSLTIWLQNVKSNTEESQVNVELLSFNEDVLLDALLIDDTQMNAFAEATLINEVVIKAELSEQNLDNLILDSMISEDSLLDDYLGNELIENIIL
jgi:hypothetical protein